MPAGQPQVGRRSMNGALGGATAMSLPAVDPETLKARLYSYPPKQAPVQYMAMRMKKPTNVQKKKAAEPSAPKLEPLVCNY